jgi:hypothetical protein
MKPVAGEPAQMRQVHRSVGIISLVIDKTGAQVNTISGAMINAPIASWCFKNQETKLRVI